VGPQQDRGIGNVPDFIALGQMGDTGIEPPAGRRDGYRDAWPEVIRLFHNELGFSGVFLLASAPAYEQRCQDESGDGDPTTHRA
jgi:hypothetical protein